MQEETDPIGVFRTWCEGWGGLPGDYQPWGFRLDHNPSRGGWALDLLADVSSASPRKPLTAAELRELLNAAGLTDDVYRAGLAALEAGELNDAPRHGGLSDIELLGALSGLRVLAAEPWHDAGMREPDSRRLGFWWLVHESADVFTAYWADVSASDRYRAETEKIQLAALDLADALRESRAAGRLSVTDARIWARALGPERVAEIRREIQCEGGRRQAGPRIWPPDAGISLDLESYLRALAEHLETNERRPLAEHAGERERPFGALRRFVLRYMRNRIPHVYPELTKISHGSNRLAALLCSVVLAQEIESDDVADAMSGTVAPRR
jgi:hypothetical protein